MTEKPFTKIEFPDRTTLKFTLRSGPHLDYVADKMRKGIVSTHSVIVGIEERLSGERVKIIKGLEYSYRNQVIAWLALQDMLSESESVYVNNPALCSPGDLEEWLDKVEEEGRLT